MRQLIHSGVMMPKPYETKGLHISVKGNKVRLTPEQEEMAVAYAKKIGTDYVKDPVFVRNFFTDFSKALGLAEVLRQDEVDLSEVLASVEREKEIRLGMSKEEKKSQAEARKAIREANKEQYGYAIVDGERVEVGNYVAEPSCIFMGRGKHPLRGRWKQGPRQSDIILNLSPDAPKPPGNWKEIIWEPEYMWTAKWDDKLGGKEKYIWLGDTSNVKQQRDKEKFNRARELEKTIEKVRNHIILHLNADDIKRRKVATVCYLIDLLKLRVGDEKDEDEADTVGATTLRSEHVRIAENGMVTFDFLGKDSVRWKTEVQLPEAVVKNLNEFVKESNSSIFNGVRSDAVGQFLSEIFPDLTAKVFRTYHATKAVKEYLSQHKIPKAAPEHEKKHVATLANLQAAVVCHHKRTLPKNWKESLKKKRERLRKLKEKKTKKSLQRIEKAKLELERMKATRDFNLGTSLKSYIDPRVYKDWGRKIEYDWKLYYPKTLQRKFSWIDTQQR